MKKALIGVGLTLGALLLAGWLLIRAVFAPSLELIAQADSPDGAWRVEAYLVNGGATTAYGVRAFAKELTGFKRTRRIYWQYREEEAEIVWLDERTVSVNGVILDVRYDSYDYRDATPAKRRTP